MTDTNTIGNNTGGNATGLNKPQHVISLATSSVLVSVDMSVWSATQQDRSVSDEVTRAKKADRNAGRFIKHILADDPVHKKVVNYRQTVYNWLQRCTYDWSGSQRLLPAINLPKFMQEYLAHEKAFYALVEEFLAKYPTIVSDMAFKQGDLFRREDYPGVEQIRRKFSMHLYTAEVPLGDFRCQVSQDLAEDLFNNYSRQAETLIRDVLNKQAEQLVDVMESLSHCCDTETKTDKDGNTVVRKRKIYDSTVSRAIELCDNFKTFNLTANPKLEAARGALERALSGLSAEQIRENDSVRAKVKTEVDEILSKFGKVVEEEPEEPEYDEEEARQFSESRGNGAGSPDEFGEEGMATRNNVGTTPDSQGGDAEHTGGDQAGRDAEGAEPEAGTDAVADATVVGGETEAGTGEVHPEDEDNMESFLAKFR